MAACQRVHVAGILLGTPRLLDLTSQSSLSSNCQLSSLARTQTSTPWLAPLILFSLAKFSVLPSLAKLRVTCRCLPQQTAGRRSGGGDTKRNADTDCAVLLLADLNVCAIGPAAPPAWLSKSGQQSRSGRGPAQPPPTVGRCSQYAAVVSACLPVGAEPSLWQLQRAPSPAALLPPS